MSLGDGYAISKQIDPSTVDMAEWGNVFSDLMEKWIASNPEKCEQTAQRIVSYINEYLKFIGCHKIQFKQSFYKLKYFK